jgi:sulfur carrier protein
MKHPPTLAPLAAPGGRVSGLGRPGATDMLTLTLNGVATDVDASTIGDLVAALGLRDKRIAVEKNGEIVPRSRYASTPLAHGDRLEIVGAVGGG